MSNSAEQASGEQILALDRTVGSIAAAIPSATRVFETVGIDYCCGGRRTLAEACARAGLSTDAVISALREAEPPPVLEVDWRTVSMSVLVSHLVDVHHAYTREALARIDRLSAKVERVHGSSHPEVITVRAGFEALAADLEPHLMKEEAVLFPYVTALDAAIAHDHPRPRCPFGTIANPIRMMHLEHDAVGKVFERMRTVSRGFEAPADACGTYRALYAALDELERDLHLHIHLENNVLFPRALDAERSLSGR